MPWTYQQATGRLFLNTVFVGVGYAGNGIGLNNPAAQDDGFVGPLPAGEYTIGPPHSPPDHMGPFALPLYPSPTNEMFGRNGFFMHGDNEKMNHTASDGCMIMGLAIRSQVSASTEKSLIVMSGAAQSQLTLAERVTLDIRAPITLNPTEPLLQRKLSELTFQEAADFFKRVGPVNAYPELPILAYERTNVSMADVVAALNDADANTAVKCSSYVLVRNESENGSKGINNNYCGAQADTRRWPEDLTPLFSGTATAVEGGTGRTRIFIAFKDLADNLTFLLKRLFDRGLYIGGKTHVVISMDISSEDDLARAYHKEWVSGSADSEPSDKEKANFLSMYRQGVKLIR